MHADYDLASSVGQSSLIVQYLKTAPPEARKEIGWALWRICEENPSKIESYWPRARVIWEWRNREASAANHSPDFNEEMQQLVQLALVVPKQETLITMRSLLEGILPYIVQIEHRSVGWDSLEKYLDVQVEHDPVGAIRFYRLMHDKKSFPPKWPYHPPESHKIVETAAMNPNSREDALSLIDLLMSWGDETFKPIYDRYSH